MSELKVPGYKGRGMKLGHAIPFAAVLVLTAVTDAAAQFPPQQQPPCFNEFMPLRNEAEKRGTAIQAASKRKAPREEVCTLFRRFAEAEAKYVKYAETNATWCGIPAEAVKQMKSNHGQTLKIRRQVCAAAAPAQPRGPSLGDALGTTPTPHSSTRTGRGTFDTLTGANPLTR
ncbi:MAG: hypothetical protein GEU91_17430 [Rhizobiales bacterium]|nr:hypothetical protein [Hyphomicrobiales bacterium]